MNRNFTFFKFANKDYFECSDCGATLSAKKDEKDVSKPSHNDQIVDTCPYCKNRKTRSF